MAVTPTLTDDERELLVSILHDEIENLDERLDDMLAQGFAQLDKRRVAMMVRTNEIRKIIGKLNRP